MLELILLTSFLLLCISCKPRGSQSPLRKIKWQVEFLPGSRCSKRRRRSHTWLQTRKWCVGKGEMRMRVQHPFSWQLCKNDLSPFTFTENTSRSRRASQGPSKAGRRLRRFSSVLPSFCFFPHFRNTPSYVFLYWFSTSTWASISITLHREKGVGGKPTTQPRLEGVKMECPPPGTHTRFSLSHSLMRWILDSPSPQRSSSQFSAAFQIMFN